MPKLILNLPRNFSLKEVRESLTQIPKERTKIVVQEIGTGNLLQVLYIVDGDFSSHPVYPILW